MDERSDQVEELTLEPGAPPRSRRPRALWAVLAVLGVVVSALIVTSGGDDGTTRPGLPVALGPTVGSAEGAAADSRLAWATYVAGEDLPALGGTAPAYRLPGLVTEAQVLALADVLGIDGEVVENGPGWTVEGSSGYLEVVDGGGGQWWFARSATGGVGRSSSASGSAGCDGGPDCTTETTVTTIACGPGADCVESMPPIDGDCAVHADGFDPCALDADCARAFDPTCPDDTGAPAEPPADLPSEAEARAIALDLLAATGVDVDDAVVTVEGPDSAWYVTVEPRLDGVPSGLLGGVTVGSAGVVDSASGYLAAPERLGAYPVLDTRATIDRANAQSGVEVEATETFDSTGTAIGGVDATTIPPCQVQPDGSEICETPTVDDPGCVNAAEDDAMDRALICELPTCPEVVAPADDPAEAPEAIDCAPPIPDPGLEVGPIEVVLVHAERALVMLGAVDGSTDIYLVPAYRFTDADGGRVDLAAVADSELTTPPTTGTSAPEPVDPPAPCEPLVEEDASGSTHTVQPNPDCLPSEPQVLGEGEEPQIGVGYYVDVDTECGSGSFELGGRVWATVDTDTRAWTDSRHEGGTFTLDAPDHGTFVGDAPATKVAEFRTLGPAEDLFCMPQPRP
jgi:hypothetical protein